MIKNGTGSKKGQVTESFVTDKTHLETQHMETPLKRSHPHPVPSLFLGKISNQRLIDQGLVYFEASTSGLNERYGRGETIHTVHTWWARRPHSSMRALIFASLIKKETPENLNLMCQLGSQPIVDESVLQRARDLIQSDYNQMPPKVLDMFGGGGTIPFEAMNLGTSSWSVDANDLSVFIQKCLLEYSQQLDTRNIASIIEESGKRVLNALLKETHEIFPARKLKTKSVVAYLWTYSKECEHCQNKIVLSKRPWLSQKNNKNIAVVFSNDKSSISIKKGLSKTYKFPTNWLGKQGKVECPHCKTQNQKINALECQEELCVLVTSEGRGKGKNFIPSEMGVIPSLKKIQKLEKQTLEELCTELPHSELPLWSGVVNPALYGIKTHSDIFNPRQRLVLLLLIKQLRKEFEYLQKNYSEHVGIYVISMLSALIDQLVDWNCRLTMWISQNEQVGRAFCGPGISMLWDYVETDPLMTGPANLWKKLDRIVEGSKFIKHYPQCAHVEHGYAQKLRFDDNSFDAIITDPPYYDNIYYSILADFFFVWKRILFQLICPQLFERKTTDISHELVASSQRTRGKGTHDEYCKQLILAIKEAERVLKPEGIMSFIYSHSSQNGWDAVVKAFRASQLIITSVQPLSIERKQRPRSMSSQAVNTCLVFVGRKLGGSRKKTPHIDEITERLRTLCKSEFPSVLEEYGWVPDDIALALFSQGVGMLANASAINGVSDNFQSLTMIEDIVCEKYGSFRIKKRKSL